MTVEELIAELELMNPDAVVKVEPDWFRIDITKLYHDAVDNEVIIG